MIRSKHARAWQGLPRLVAALEALCLYQDPAIISECIPNLIEGGICVCDHMFITRFYLHCEGT
jgi:hypothetical protein